MLRQENGPVLKSPNVGTRRGLKSQIALSACCRPRRTCAFKSLRPALDVLQPQIQSNLCWTSSNISPQNTHTHVDCGNPGRGCRAFVGKVGRTSLQVIPLLSSRLSFPTQTTATPAPARKNCWSLMCVVAVVTSWCAPPFLQGKLWRWKH